MMHPSAASPLPSEECSGTTDGMVGTCRSFGLHPICEQLRNTDGKPNSCQNCTRLQRDINFLSESETLRNVCCSAKWNTSHCNEGQVTSVDFAYVETCFHTGPNVYQSILLLEADTHLFKVLIAEVSFKLLNWNISPKKVFLLKKVRGF
jgi:hypothetical protein